MKKTKKLLAGLLTVIIALSSIGLNVSAEETETAQASFNVGGHTVNVGDYFQMGTYYGKPILWRCVNVDENGPLMLSDKILCLKAFDFAGEDTSGSHGRGDSNGEIWSMGGVVPTRPQSVKDARSEHGSNYWGDSNIRDWLNSDADAGNVEWSCGNPPTAVYLDGPSSDPVEKSYGYADEAGFLNGFTESEKLAVKTVTQKQLLDHSEYGFDENYHIAEYPVADVLQNYETAASETTTDKMFLLDVKQFYDVYTNFGDYCYAYPTALAVANDTNVRNTRGTYRQTESNNDPPYKDKTYYYWLRTPFNNSHKYTYIKDNDIVTETYYSAGCSTRVVGLKDGYHNNEAVTFELSGMNDIGVRPAFYLDTANAEITDGDGSTSDPYVINGPKNETSFTIGNKTYNVGDYFQLGTYNKQPVTWRCIAVDENGPLMFANEILCNKEFDIEGSKRVSDDLGSHWRNYSARNTGGSNYWGDSNIHDWLNSDAEAGKVEWTCHNAPSYKDEQGFLNGFTDNEKAALKEATQRQLLYSAEYTNILYGETEYEHIYNENIADVLQNYNEAYGETMTDKVFLLDVKQVYRMYQNFGDYYKAPGKAYWLRTPSRYGSSERYVDAEGNVPRTDANTKDIGVRPAFYLDTAAADITGGNGTETDAYVINGSEASNTVVEYDAVGGKIYFDTATGTITSADSTITEVTIPETIEGVEVRAVAANAFASCTSLEKVYCDKESPANNADLYPTGTVIIYDEPSAEFVFGDADADSVVTASDAAFVLQKTLISTFELPIQKKTDDWLKYVDVDADTNITASDAAFILQKTLISTFELPAEKKYK